MPMKLAEPTRLRGRFGWLVLALAAFAVAAGVFAFLERPWDGGVAVIAAEVLQPGPIAMVLAVNGRVVPRQEVGVRSPVTERVRSVAVVEGQEVSRGEVLIELDDARVQAQVDQARAALDAGSLREQQAQAAVDRAQALGENISRTAREEAERALSSARSEVTRLRAALAEAQALLSQYTIIAPLDGIVLDRSAEPGQLADTQTILLDIAAVDELHVETSVDEMFAARIRVGLPARLQPVGRTIASPGTVIFAAPAVDPDTGGRSVRIAFDEPAGLPVGLTVNVNIIVDEFDAALSVPRSALLIKGGSTSVLVITDGVVTERPVEVVDWPADRIKVDSGLEPGDAVVLEPDTVTIGQAALPKT
jgi:RND family efflux transporter MFP subunit